MDAGAQRWRLALFGACASGLCLAAIWFAGGASDRAAAPAEPAVASLPAFSERGAELIAKLRVQAQRFLGAFLRYEAGESGAGLRRALRGGSSPSFAAELLSAPPRRPRSDLPPATLQRVSIELIPSSPPRALVSASAARPAGVEHLSFLFDLRGDRWLARGVGE